MKKAEVQKLKTRFAEGSVIDAETLNHFINHELVFSNPASRRFAIFDLTRQNVIYQLNTNLYKISPRKMFRFEFPQDLIPSLMVLGQKYPKLEICAWETINLNGLLEMQMLKNMIFVEVDKGFETLTFECLNQTDQFTVLINPTLSLIDTYQSNKPTIIVKPLIYKAPTTKKRFSARVGYNQNYYGDRSPLSTPKIEKFIVDLIADPTLQFFDLSQRDLLIKNVLKDYVVNFKTLLSYARNRNKKDFMLDYFINNLRFDLDRGEFFDQ